MTDEPNNIYTGTKTVMARPMTAGSAYEQMSRRTPDHLNDGDEGYLVTYAPDGYISWLPKNVFEEAYKLSGTWQQRLQIEYDDLAERTGKLADFLSEGHYAGHIASERQVKPDDYKEPEHVTDHREKFDREAE